VIVDAIGVTKSLKTASQPLITKPGVSLKNLAMGVMMGQHDEDTVSSLAARLARLDKQLDDNERARISEKAEGKPLLLIVGELFSAINPDTIEQTALTIAGQLQGTNPGDSARDQAREQLVGQAANVFSGELVELIDSIRRDKEQTLVHDDLDSVITAEWAGDTEDNAKALTQEFADYLQKHRDNIEALSIYFQAPARRSDVTYQMIRELLERLRSDRPKLAPLRVWQAYAHLDNYKGDSPIGDLTALVALLRRVTGLDNTLSTYAATVRRNFQSWIMQHHSGAGEKFNEEQMAWLQMVRDHIISSFHIERDDLEMAPFDSKGGMGRMYQLFGDGMDEVIKELNRELVA
jgi:type I restriction enzyme R subunit